MEEDDSHLDEVDELDLRKMTQRDSIDMTVESKNECDCSLDFSVDKSLGCSMVKCKSCGHNENVRTEELNDKTRTVNGEERFIKECNCCSSSATIFTVEFKNNS